MNLEASRSVSSPMIPSRESSALCQCFAVLEDGALAHNLQEQEIEQYYTTNIQKNQLVQNDIRVAKRLQDEEEEQWAQQSALLRQTSRQLEEQDFEYARLIQEEILRHAEEAERREQDDEEMAKRIQEEEKEKLRRSSSRGLEGHSEGSVSDPALSIPPQHTLSSLHQGEEHYSSTTTRWQCSTSNNHSNFSEPKAESRSGVLAQKNTTSRSNQGHADSFREIRREPLSEDSEDSDTVFSEWLPDVSQRVNERHAMAPSQRHTSFHHPLDRNEQSPCPRCTLSDELRVWEEERGELDECCYKNGDLEKRSHRSWAQERNHREEYEGVCRSRDLNRDSRSGEERERRCSHSESFRLPERSRQSNRNLARTWSYRDYSDKHVRFRDDSGSFSRQRGESSGVWEMLGQVLRERGVPVRIGSNGVPLQIRPESRDSQVLHGSVVSCSDSQPHQRLFQRASTARHSFHGDIREKKRLSYQANSGRDHREGRDRHCNIEERCGEVFEIRRRDSYLGNGERGGGRRWKEHRCASDDVSDRTVKDCGVKRATSERRHWHNTIEERLSSEEEQEVERRGEQHRRRAPQRSQSLRSSRASTRDRSRRVAAGASLQPELSKERLDLGELQQVLQDEELARKLQEEEEKRLRRNSRPTCSSYPEGDFRVAQVAQDEEIAHFMQKQEIKSKRRSRELEGPSSWREHKAMISHHGRQHRQVHRERLDSEGLPSPTDDGSPDNQPPSPASTLLQTQHIRNIAEELDPTFQARRQGTESLRVGQAGSTNQSLPTPHSGLHDFLEEPTFIPPTKRQTDKSGRCKPKEKKENCKQQ